MTEEVRTAGATGVLQVEPVQMYKVGDKLYSDSYEAAEALRLAKLGERIDAYLNQRGFDARERTRVRNVILGWEEWTAQADLPF